MLNKLIILTVIVVLAQAAKPKHYELENYNFTNYLQDFGKHYSEEDMEMRQGLFEKKLQDIKVHNSDETKNWKKGVNQFSDLTQEELKNYKGFSGNLQNQRKNSNTQNTYLLPNDLPTELDWREKGNVTSPVKDSMNCSSSWAMATAEIVETAVAINITLNITLTELSTQQLIDCAPNSKNCGGTGGCGGATQEQAFDYLKLYGFEKSSDYNYTAEKGQCLETEDKIYVTVENFEYVTPANNAEAVQNALFLQPLGAVVDSSFFVDYEEGIFEGCPYSNNMNLDHYVAIWGYGTDNTTNMTYWLVRNSWGETWGEKGYIRLRWEKQHFCGIDFTPTNGITCAGDKTPQQTCGQCGILTNVVLPKGVKVKKTESEKRSQSKEK